TATRPTASSGWWRTPTPAHGWAAGGVPCTAGLSRRHLSAVNVPGCDRRRNPSSGGCTDLGRWTGTPGGVYARAMPDLPLVQGECHPGFAAVREAFARNLRDRDEIGAAVAVVVDGTTVVDLWGGYADLDRTRPWERDTIVNVYSCTRGMTALCAHRLVSEGRLDLDAPVADYWPEFAQAGKESLPVRWLIAHRAGLAAVRRVLPGDALYDWDAMCATLAAETPWWTPGTAHGYHAVTFGWLVGEVVRRITGRSLGTYFRQEIAQPLELDFHLGFPGAEPPRGPERSGIPMPPDEDRVHLAAVIMSDPEGLAARAFMNPPSM